MIDYQKALKDTFHLSFLMPHQELVVTRILECVEKEERTGSITILPTGAGKSLIFMLPSFIIEDRYEILVYPLLALMHDQKRRFEESGINATLLSGGNEQGGEASGIVRAQVDEEPYHNNQPRDAHCNGSRASARLPHRQDRAHGP